MEIWHALRLLLRWVSDTFCANARLRAENALLRHQLHIATRTAKKPRLNWFDRVVFAGFRAWAPAALNALVLIKPETVKRWHQMGFHLLWRWKSRPHGGRPPKDRALRELILHLCRDNPLWGAPRIHGELGKLGYDVCEATVAKYMKRHRPGGRCIGWKTFMRLHACKIAAVDMLTVRTLTYDCLYAFVILGLGRREILHVEVTMHPTAQWLARQITEAFPWDTAPGFIVRDNDGAYGRVFRWRLKAMGIRDTPIAPHSPWQNGYAERVIGSIRRECLDHLIPRNAKHLRRVLREYLDYYNKDRTHLALEKDSPRSRPVEAKGTVVSTPILGGLHHRYWRI